jgi:hypothetical protein
MHPEIDKTLLLEHIRAEHRFVERTLEMMTQEQMVTPNVIGWWSVKDTLAHLTSWVRRLTTWLDAATHDQQPVMPEAGYGWDQIDPLNDRQSELDKDRPLDEVLADFRQTHYAAVEVVEALSEYDIFERKFQGFRDPLYGYITDNTDGHYHEHIIEIRRWLNEQRA